jgi:thymidylate synthase
MNELDKQYTALLQDILDNGVEKKETRNGGTLSVFGRQIRHKMSEGFPLLTTKKMPFKTIVTELLWFLRGDTNIKYLVDNNCHIWDGDAYKNWLNNWKPIGEGPIYNNPLSKEEFINKIKTDDEFAKKWGELGPIYGKQWRNWRTPTGITDVGVFSLKSFEIDNIGHRITYETIDQIANLIHDLKTNPDSRRLLVSAWNPAELDQMVLPPCHYGFQVYTRELSINERRDWCKKNNVVLEHLEAGLENEEDDMRANRVPIRAISLMWNQRSVDTFLGLPFNIASYGLLLEIIAKEVNMVPDELIGNLGDVHLYSNHIEQAKEQIGRELTHRERIEKLFETNKDAKSLLSQEEPEVISSLLLDELKIPKRTREPFELPTVTITERNWYQHEKVKEHLGEKTFIQKIESYRPEDFTLNNYQSHPAIKAPLSN